VKAKFKLASILRVRRVQEDVALAELAKARRERKRAEAQTDARRGPLGAHHPPERSTATALVAAMASGLSMAANLSAAKAVQADAEADADTAARSWSGAAGRVRALESLAERHRAAAHTALWQAEQRELDDMAIRMGRDDREDGL
jgi:flagellar FliJ protein